MAFNWTPEALERAASMWTAGASGSQIARALTTRGGGPTRSAVVGKLYRMGLLKGRGKEVGRLNTKAASTRTIGIVNAKRLTFTGGARRVEAMKRSFEPKPPVVFDASLAKPWTERRFGECAYPVSGEGADTHSCCQPTKGHTYCKAHRRIMFVKPTPGLDRLASKVAA